MNKNVGLLFDFFLRYFVEIKAISKRNISKTLQTAVKNPLQVAKHKTHKNYIAA